MADKKTNHGPTFVVGLMGGFALHAVLVSADNKVCDPENVSEDQTIQSMDIQEVPTVRTESLVLEPGQ